MRLGEAAHKLEWHGGMPPGRTHAYGQEHLHIIHSPKQCGRKSREELIQSTVESLALRGVGIGEERVWSIADHDLGLNSGLEANIDYLCVCWKVTAKIL